MKWILNGYYKVNSWYVKQGELKRLFFAFAIALSVIAIPGFIAMKIGDFLAGV